MILIEKIERLEREKESIIESLNGFGAANFSKVKRELKKDLKHIEKRIENLKEHAGMRYQIKYIAENLIKERGKPYNEEASHSLIMLLEGNWSIRDIETVQLCYGVKFNVYVENQVPDAGKMVL
jgi:DUF917 family protein